MNAYVTSFALAVILYGLIGSPTPDHPGWPEFLIGLLLILSIGVGGVWYAFQNNGTLHRFFQPLFLYGVSVSLLIGVMQGHGAVLILRDVLAFGFILLPLFLTHRMTGYRQIFERLIIFCGLCFALRALLPVYGVYPAPDVLLYLANSPMVLMSALLLSLGVMRDFYDWRLGIGTIF